jgi:glucose-1-phosphate cytidylyltransferase
MKAVILAGGFGTRLSEETGVKPKPMVEIGGKPILWHILKIFSAQGVNEFIICCGFKGAQIKEYFADYYLQKADVTFDLARQKMTLHTNNCEPWRVTLVDTGANTMTGGRLKRVRDYVGGERFFFTYGDGVSDVDLDKLLAFHRSHGRLATITAVRPPARFGRLDLEGDAVARFSEKPQLEEGWINGAFFVLEPGVFDYIDGDDIQWEREPLEHLARDGQLMAYRHHDFWQCMDTLRDKKLLQSLWDSREAPWKVWAS